MLVSNILSYKDFLKDSAEPLELKKAMVRRYNYLSSISRAIIALSLANVNDRPLDFS